MKDWPADTVERRKVAYVRDRRCVVCGRVDRVRRDSKSETCKPCAARASLTKGTATIKARARRSCCDHCGCEYGGGNVRFCSRACRNAAAVRVRRNCKMCGSEFTVLASTLRSNASGNFCTRPCYESFLCRTDRKTGRGSQWRSKRADAVRRSPFCAICGTRENLQVHHIIPFRISADNSRDNLMPLCTKHHRFVETILVGTEAFGFDSVARLAWIGMLKERQMATAIKLMSLAEC